MSTHFKLEADKLKDVLLYTFSKCTSDKIGAVKLHKVLYFSDMMTFAQSRKPMTGAVYRKRPFGPTCDYLLRALRELEQSGEITIGKQDYFGFQKTAYRLTRPYLGSNKLSDNDRAVLDEVIAFVCYNNSARTVSEFSHNRAWELAEQGEEIPYHSVLQLVPQEVSLEAMEWASDEALKVETERSTTDPVGYVSLAAFRGRVRKEHV